MYVPQQNESSASLLLHASLAGLTNFEASSRLPHSRRAGRSGRGQERRDAQHTHARSRARRPPRNTTQHDTHSPFVSSRHPPSHTRRFRPASCRRSGDPLARRPAAVELRRCWRRHRRRRSALAGGAAASCPGPAAPELPPASPTSPWT